MRTIKLTVILLIILFTFSCNNQQSKKEGNDTLEVENPISEETIIEKNDKTEKAANTTTKKLKTCENLAEEILTTSPRYKQLTKGLLEAVKKNKGQSFGITLDGSPNPSEDKAWKYSKTYDFTLYEMYAERRLNTTLFSFNPQSKQLFIYDAVNERLIPIEYDKALLKEFEALCK